MDKKIPPASGIREALNGLTHAQIQRLSVVSGVPFTTIWKVRDGTTTNPGIETVRQFYHLIDSVAVAVAPTLTEGA